MSSNQLLFFWKGITTRVDRKMGGWVDTCSNIRLESAVCIGGAVLEVERTVGRHVLHVGFARKMVGEREVLG